MHNRMNKLICDALAVRPVDRAFEVKNASDGAHVYVYDVIDPYWGIGAKAFADQLNALTDQTIHLHINSPGGDVFEARAMVTVVRAHASDIVSHIDGIAASSASWLALAADRVEIADGAFLMVHNSWSLAMGNAQDLRSLADVLDKIDGSIVADYVRKSGQDLATVQGWMTAETWFSAQEALDAKLVDAVIGAAGDGGPKALGMWNLEAFERTPQILQNLRANALQEQVFDHAAAERRLRLLERVGA